jgi:NifB/MoaA-like Fe-S oxidoreductase
VIDIIEEFSGRWLSERGERIAYPADEFFIKAGREIPPASYYGDFAQLENGVGIIADTLSSFRSALLETPPSKKLRKYTVATGRAAEEAVALMCKEAMEADPNLDVSVKAIESRFFGGYITVAGLVVGSDITGELSGTDCGMRFSSRDACSGTSRTGFWTT